jgi:hypothetical protein
VRRVSVVGNSGSGKTTLAVGLAGAMGVPHLELDSVFHQPNWQPLETELFRARVTEFIAADSWVVDGNYSKVQDLIWLRADTVVWLDLPRYQVMRQLTARTLRRMVTRQELWNGNTEPLGNLFRLNPEESILAWAWTHHRRYADRYRAAQEDPSHQHLTFVRVPSRAAMARLIAGASAQPGGVTGE